MLNHRPTDSESEGIPVASTIQESLSNENLTPLNCFFLSYTGSGSSS